MNVSLLHYAAFFSARQHHTVNASLIDDLDRAGPFRVCGSLSIFFFGFLFFSLSLSSVIPCHLGFSRLTSTVFPLSVDDNVG